jgi:hypothetical protein
MIDIMVVIELQVAGQSAMHVLIMCSAWIQTSESILC